MVAGTEGVMARKSASRRDSKPPAAASVKVTVRLSLGTAQRLGVESSMRRISQSAIVESVLAAYLKRWRLPSTVEGAPTAGDAGDAGNAA
jgi:hypothetical protein